MFEYYLTIDNIDDKTKPEDKKDIPILNSFSYQLQPIKDTLDNFDAVPDNNIFILEVREGGALSTLFHTNTKEKLMNIFDFVAKNYINKDDNYGKDTNNEFERSIY